MKIIQIIFLFVILLSSVAIRPQQLNKTTTEWEWTQLLTVPTFSICFDNDNANIIFACTEEGLLKTTDGGLTWEKNGNANPEYGIEKMYFDPKRNNIAYLVSVMGILKSTDRGDTWSLTSLLQRDFEYPYVMAIHPENTDTLYVGFSNWIGTRDLCRSTDGGVTWDNLNITNSEDSIIEIVFDPANPAIIYVATANTGIFKTTDKGQSWFTINTGLQKYPPYYTSVKPITSLKINPSNPMELYTDNGGVVKTTNGGDNWFNIDSTLFGIEQNLGVIKIFYSNGSLYVLHIDISKYIIGLYYGTSDGLNWQKIGEFNAGNSSSFDTEVIINPQIQDEVFVSIGTGLYKGRLKTSLVKIDNDIPELITLYQNYPNPFNSSTQITFELNKRQLVKIVVYDILGREIKVITSKDFNSGYYSIMWDGTNNQGNSQPTGVYFYRLLSDNFSETKKMLLLQ